jgi:hypothetical protein
MESVFSGEIYKIIYNIGNVTTVYSVGQPMKETGITISRIVRDAGYFLETQRERFVVYAYITSKGEKSEEIYDEIFGGDVSIRRNLKK